MMIWKIFLVSLALLGADGKSYQPGKPGGAWESEEVDIVREKVKEMVVQKNYAWGRHGPTGIFVKEGTFTEWEAGKGRRPMTSRLIRLAFHDCLKMIDDEGKTFGGCDGCLNWEGMGFEYEEGWLPPEDVYSYPIKYKTDNNALAATVKALELIYTNTSWPPNTNKLPVSLKNSGKSRADLWQLAANVALEIEIERANYACDKDFNSNQQITILEGRQNCDIKLHKPITFQYGRVDCIADELKKKTDFPYESTYTEKHSNPWGSGDQVLKDLKEDFNFTARESIALMAAHSIAPQDHNKKMVTKYRWIGAPYLSNMYFKYLTGTPSYDRRYGLGFDPTNAFHSFGDKNGSPIVGSGWLIHCHGIWNTTSPDGGPCHFRPTKMTCKRHSNDDERLRWWNCFGGFDEQGNPIAKTDGHCKGTTFDEQYRIQTGGVGHEMTADKRCNHEWTFVFNYELNFVLNFTIDEENRPRGCNKLDMDIKDIEALVGEDQVIKCPRNHYAPEGESTSHIVRTFAEHHDEWAMVFLDAWHKMQANGYGEESLRDGPKNSWLGYSYLESDDDLVFPVVFTDNSKADPYIDCADERTFKEICAQQEPGVCPPDF